jgi:hypothetical protein
LHGFSTTLIKNPTVSVKRASTKAQIGRTTAAFLYALMMFLRGQSIGTLSGWLVDLGAPESQAQPLGAERDYSPLTATQ